MNDQIKMGSKSSRHAVLMVSTKFIIYAKVLTSISIKIWWSGLDGINIYGHDRIAYFMPNYASEK
jgi:hypothetical protein